MLNWLSGAETNNSEMEGEAVSAEMDSAPVPTAEMMELTSDQVE